MSIERAISAPSPRGLTQPLIYQDGAKIFGYGRASTSRQSITIGAQEIAVQAYHTMREATGEAWEWGGYFPDAAVTSKINWLERPMGQRLFVLSNPGDIIVVANFDRAFRSVVDCQISMDRLIQKQVGLAILDIDVDTTKPLGRAFLKIMAVIKELERDEMSRRTTEALAYNKATGRPTSKQAPIGWKTVPHTETVASHYEIDHEQRANAEEILRIYMSGRSTIRKLSKKLEARRRSGDYHGIMCRDSLKWCCVAARLQFPLTSCDSLPRMSCIMPLIFMNEWIVSPALDLSIYDHFDVPVPADVRRAVRTCRRMNRGYQGPFEPCGPARLVHSGD